MALRPQTLFLPASNGGNMATAPPTRLIVELELYETHKTEWLQSHRDQFVVIKEKNLLGFFGDFHEAYRAGVDKFGVATDFLVKRVGCAGTRVRSVLRWRRVSFVLGPTRTF